MKTTFEELERDGQKSVVEMAIEKLNSGFDGYGCDLHSEIYNTYYFIIGRYQAEEWLKKNIGVFNAIGIIKDYEQSNFGEVSTDLSESERVCNMLVYIAGEDLLNESEHLRKKWDVRLTEKDCKKIAKELRKLIE